MQETEEIQVQSWVGKILWRRAWQPTPVFLPGEFHWQRSLMGYSPWGHKEWDTTEATEHTYTFSDNIILLKVFIGVLQQHLPFWSPVYGWVIVAWKRWVTGWSDPSLLWSPGEVSCPLYGWAVVWALQLKPPPLLVFWLDDNPEALSGSANFI